MNYISEFLGVMILIVLNDGVVANVKLSDSGMRTNDSAFLICIASGLAVFIPICIFGRYSGAHFNPAVTIALAVTGQFPAILILPYILCQFAGAFTGAVLVWILYQKHMERTEDGNIVRSVFCTGPSIRQNWLNLISEIIGTFVLVFSIISIKKSGIGGNSAILVFALVTSIGMSFGGLTGFAINPARDLGPRLAHTLLPIKNKIKDWKYAWIPVVGPILGAFTASILYIILPW